MPWQPANPPEDLEAQDRLQRSTALQRYRGWALLGAVVVIAAAALVLLHDGRTQAQQEQNVGALRLLTATPSATETSAPTPTSSATPTPDRDNIPGGESLQGLIVLSRSEQGYWRLFALDPITNEYTRLTYGPWNDIDPAISPDGAMIAFASNRGGGYDLYTLDVASGEVTQISEDLDYDGAPSWSPDGSWLAYEHYVEGNLEIYMRPLDGSVDPVRISANPGADFGPAWSPAGQQIAFISDRGGSQQVWLVDLEASGAGRFRDLSAANIGMQRDIAWSPDGSQLAWAAQLGETWHIYLQDMDSGDFEELGLGQAPAWNASGDAIAALYHSQSDSYVSAYALNGALTLAPVQVAGDAAGLAWGPGRLPDPLPNGLRAAAEATPVADWVASLEPANQVASSLLDPAELEGVTAPDPYLNPLVLPAFNALRTRAAQALGWDVLSQLEYALVPIEDPLSPGRQEDWLYTGRGFALPSALLDAGWLQAVRQDYGGQVYWRIYLRAAAQDGSQGRPMVDLPWDFSARYIGTDRYYEAGGRLASSVPGGYWVDFTALAAEYGFRPQPALDNWQSYFQGSLFNLFVLDGGLSWDEAMLQLYRQDNLAGAGFDVTP